jgi:tripartite-type tricarboxylate transporter receptor subunit TctC
MNKTNKTNKTSLGAVAAVFAFAVAASVSNAALAQTFPAKPVQVVVGFPPGGGTDIFARALAQAMQASLGQPVVVENRPGAGGVVASQAISAAAPDGYQLLVGSTSTQIIAPLLFAKRPYDPIADFTPIAHFAGVGIVLVANPKAPYDDFRQFLAYAKSHPGQLDYGSGGNGVTNHLAMEIVKARAKVYLVHIPYRGSALALQDVVGGQLPVMFDSIASALPMIRAGRVKALAVASSERSEVLPNVATISEAGKDAGLAGFDASGWTALYGPRNLPAPVVARLESAVAQALKNPEVAQRFASQGATPKFMAAAEFTRFQQGELAKWGEAVRYSGAKQD